MLWLCDCRTAKGTATKTVITGSSTSFAHTSGLSVCTCSCILLSPISVANLWIRTVYNSRLGRRLSIVGYFLRQRSTSHRRGCHTDIKTYVSSCIPNVIATAISSSTCDDMVIATFHCDGHRHLCCVSQKICLHSLNASSQRIVWFDRHCDRNCVTNIHRTRSSGIALME